MSPTAPSRLSYRGSWSIPVVNTPGFYLNVGKGRDQREKKDLAFRMANGQLATRSVGFAIIRLDKFFIVDEAVFAEKGNLLLLGARTLKGLNLVVDPRKKNLVAAGPLPAAANA
jgi:hypothetical protein